MREQLATMAMFSSEWGGDDFLIEPLLDGYRGRERSLQPFRRIGYGSFQQNCIEAGFPNFHAAWKQLADRRNHHAHTASSPDRAPPLVPDQIHSFIHESIKVFASLRNLYNRETAHYRAATEGVSKRRAERHVSELDDNEE